MKNALFIALFLSCSYQSQAEIRAYQSTDNSGLNKQERIESIESYLIGLSRSLQEMESKLNENSKTLSNLDKTVKSMVEADKLAAQKSVQAKNEEKKEKAPEKMTPEKASEIEKLRADMLVLKNEDIERLKVQYFDMNETIKAIKATLRDQVKLSH